MEIFRITLSIFGSIFILFGYLRFITDDKGNVDLNNYRFTGKIGHVILGLIDGTQDVFSRHLTSNAISTIVVYFGVLLLFIAFKI